MVIIPSGKCLLSYHKSPSLRGKSTVNGPFFYNYISLPEGQWWRSHCCLITRLPEVNSQQLNKDHRIIRRTNVRKPKITNHAILRIQPLAEKKNGTSPTKTEFTPWGGYLDVPISWDIHSEANGNCMELRSVHWNCQANTGYVSNSSTETQEIEPILRQLHLALHNRIYSPKMSMYCSQKQQQPPSILPRLHQLIPDRQLQSLFPASVSLLIYHIIHLQ